MDVDDEQEMMDLLYADIGTRAGVMGFPETPEHSQT
jgi:hypothetical protein